MMKGYKVFNPDFTCRGFQYEVGKTYEEDLSPDCCHWGFHFCEQAKDCFDYYGFNQNNRVAEVEALGEISESGNKCCTNKIHIIRELTWHEVLELVNSGKACTGVSNIGDCNTGDFNKASNVIGCFNTEPQKLKFFDKETDMTLDEWRNSSAYCILSRIDSRPSEWVGTEDMSHEEKAEYPEHKITGGFLWIRNNTCCYSDWWGQLSERDKSTVKNIPNFDAEKFYQITGIKIEQEKTK